ncbi:MAG TPA: hypothetical protein VJN18_00195 [Polyangiaceae bacterium]|nr:hypothetical protein [Polyangiaceae bacterium]
MRGLAVGCFLLALLTLASCQRKLPGPQECRAFALASLGLRAETPATLLARDPRLTARAEELTQICLTKPWDYQLLGCLQHGGGQQRCLMGFEQRRSLRSASDNGL